jgi:hypothetical protein
VGADSQPGDLVSYGDRGGGSEGVGMIKGAVLLGAYALWFVLKDVEGE